MNKMKMVGLIVVVMFGVFMVIYGGYDDSPGGQLLGLVVAIVGAVGVLRIWKISKRNNDKT